MKQSGREPGASAASGALASRHSGISFWDANRIPRWIFGVVLVAAIVLAYQPVWRAGFIWDDDVYVTENTLLVWQLLRRLNTPAAWLGAALFALHPVQVESVAWITERKNVLSLFFCLLTLLGWNEFVETRGRRRLVFYCLGLVTYALALFSKTTACTLPAAIVLLLWLKSKPIDWRRFAQVLPFFMMGLGMGLLTIWWERYHV